MRRAVVERWRPPDRKPIELSAGDTVAVGSRDDEWPGFVWCTAADGVGGWVPEELLDDTTMLADYSAVELAVDPGDEVTAHRFIQGWWWCRRNDGAEGWLPEGVLGPPGG